MIISVKDTHTDILVNSVILSHNKEFKKENTEFMRCFRCGTGLAQVQGFIGTIYAGYIPSDEVPTITRCHNCLTNYTFQTQDKVGNNWTKLILPALTTVATFHCIACRCQLLQYTIQGAVLLPDFTKINMPAPFGCHNHICKAKYLLRDIVESENIV